MASAVRRIGEKGAVEEKVYTQPVRQLVVCCLVVQRFDIIRIRGEAVANARYGDRRWPVASLIVISQAKVYTLPARTVDDER